MGVVLTPKISCRVSGADHAFLIGPTRLCPISMLRTIFYRPRVPAHQLLGWLVVLAAMSVSASRSQADGAPGAVPFLKPARVYQTTRLTGPAPVIDGRLGDSCWKELGEWSGDYTQREPREGAKPSLPTELKVLYDNRFVYVAIRAFDPDVASRPRLVGSRDEFTGDMVGINFDSYRDRLNGFEFDVTSGGSKIDLILHNDLSCDVSWNAIWDVKTAVEEKAWTAEFRIPLSQLRYQKGKDQTWGMHCWRWIGSLQEESDWNLLPMDNHGALYSFGEIKGIRDLPASRRLEVAPYVVAKTHRYAPEPGNPYRNGKDSTVEGGLDVKYGLGSNLTLDLTVNPDFSQVDADPSEINLSTVETFRSERRPLFLEGKDIFEVKLDDDLAFYTRRIGDNPSLSPPNGCVHDEPESNRILGAAKLTGHIPSGLTVGLLHAVVDRTTARIVDAQGAGRRVTVEPPTNDTVVRLQQDFDGGNTRVGTILSSCLRGGPVDELQTLPRRALMFGADAIQYFANRTYFAEGRVLGTAVSGSSRSIADLMQTPAHNYQRVDADYLDVDSTASRLLGNAGFFRGGRGSGLWRYNGFLSWRSPGVDFNDLGYMQVADFIAPGALLQYYDASAGKLLRRRDLRLKFTRPQNYGGECLGQNVYLESEFTTLSGAYLWTKFGAETARLDLHVLRGGPALRLANRYPAKAYFETDGGKPFQYKVDAEATTSGGGSRRLRAEPGIVWKYGGRLKTSLSIGYEQLHEAEQYAGTASGAPAPAYVMGSLEQQVLYSTLRVSFNYSPALSLSYFGGPFVATGHFSDYKVVINPRAVAEDRRYASVPFEPVSDGALTGFFQGDQLRINNPDFNWREFKSNLVLRWEYRAGSFFYCVWSQYRSDAGDIGGFAPSSQHERLFSAHPDNTLLVKFSYWFSL